ncbi:MAG: F420-nonreducing hydrogenase, partial [Coriobacteriia bacterium]|nr:F420-nonreducing hydrogenase [Coriobacteriia bacterium]
MSKPRLSHVILGGCEGCYVSLLDAHEGLVDLLDSVEVVYSPLTDTGEMQECEVVIVEGAVTTEHDEVALREAR